jgi:adenine phosphoribosyltransferase
MKNLQTVLREHKKLELQAHVSIDDVLLKINQEVAELLQVIDKNDEEEVKKESQDVLVNILSVGSHVGVLPKSDSNIFFNDVYSTRESISTWLVDWNRNIGALRKRYSREWISDTTFQVRFEIFAAMLLSLSGEQTYSEVVKKSSEKFRQRIQEYLPKISLKEYISEYPDFPKPGILFRDISPLLQNPEAFRYVCFELAKNCIDADVIAGFDARGFLFGVEVAQILWKPFVMIRKKWKLPGETEAISYWLEYGQDTIEIQKWSIQAWQKVALIDDLLATWGTALAGANLIEKLGWVVDSLNFVISLDDDFLSSQEPRQALKKYQLHRVVSYS